MQAQSIRGVGVAALLALLFPALGGCGGGNPSPATCPKGSSPCGNGCIPGAGSVCCEDHFGAASSSYCTNPAGGGCFANGSRGCKAAFPFDTSASFCCGPNGTIGTNDCPEGQHHCGLLCVPLAKPCCPPGSTAAQCPTEATECSGGKVSCGACAGGANLCYSCPSGSCCGFLSCDGNGVGGGQCILNTSGTCVGLPGDPGAGTGGTCPGGWRGSLRSCVPLGAGGSCICDGLTDTCITPALFQGTGVPFPPACQAQGVSGCLNSTGTLAHPCCPGLSCKASSKCGQTNGAGGGTCLP